MTDADDDSIARDLELLRLDRSVSRPPEFRLPPGGTPAMVGRVTTTSGMAVGKYLTVNPVRLLGTEAEGSTGTLTVQPVPVPVYLVGPGVPVTGDHLICRRLDHRWAADFDVPSSGGGGVSTPSCLCSTTPATVQMVSNNTTVEGGMFQTTPLVYGPMPAVFAPLHIEDTSGNMFLSPGTYIDSATGDAFRYFLTCETGRYRLRRLYPTTTFVSPYQGDVIYSWSPTVGSGNTCIPFSLPNGQVFPGGDLAASVELHE
jgi:hypothetical protein